MRSWVSLLNRDLGKSFTLMWAFFSFSPLFSSHSSFPSLLNPCQVLQETSILTLVSPTGPIAVVEHQEYQETGEFYVVQERILKLE